MIYRRDSMHCYMIETLPFGENCYIFYDDISKECAVIDPGGSYNKIVNFINKKQLIMKAVILTHSHADHIGALEEIINFYKDIEIFSQRDFILPIIDGGVFLHETDPTIFPELPHCIDIRF